MMRPVPLLLPALLSAIALAGCTAADPARAARQDAGAPGGDGAQAATVPAYVVLGTAQDAGMPHIGCDGPHCSAARAAGRRAQVAAVGVVGESGWWLLDATPDLPAQVHAMGGLPNGIFLTHAHIGHYTGLMYLGREALGADAMPVWCSPRMAAFLRSHGPWSQLVALGQIELHEFGHDDPVELEPGLTLTALRVPHRDEFSDTQGFLIDNQGSGGSLLFLPDIDQWRKWERPIEGFVRDGAHLLLDGTFWSGDELPHRDLDEIPHPPVSQTIERLAPAVAASRARVAFLHLNHSNPLWDRSGTEAERLRAAGFHLATRGEIVPF